jgi:hypothetical protein
MQQLLINIHIFMYSKIQKYAKKFYCVLKNQTFKKKLKNILLSEKKVQFKYEYLKFV